MAILCSSIVFVRRVTGQNNLYESHVYGKFPFKTWKPYIWIIYHRIFWETVKDPWLFGEGVVSLLIFHEQALQIYGSTCLKLQSAMEQYLLHDVPCEETKFNNASIDKISYHIIGRHVHCTHPDSTLPANMMGKSGNIYWHCTHKSNLLCCVRERQQSLSLFTL